MILFKDTQPQLWLLTPEEFDCLPNGTKLQCIDQTEVIKGIDYIDQDTRMGVIAYGLLGSKSSIETQLRGIA